MVAPSPELSTAEWLASTAETELLRFTTAGSVDDGKSTLIGRLLYDSKGVYEDQLASVRKATRNLTTGGLDLSLLTDGLRAEREQGITIDVAYRYFSTPKRKFIIADTPGHEQYTRNMATGASTANLAIILVDARLGILPQSRRHAFIAALLGIPHLVVAINKMDLMDFSEDVFRSLRDEFSVFLDRVKITDVTFIPISALKGDNVVAASQNTPWYNGPTLLQHLEKVPIAEDHNQVDFRFPVQNVIRPNLDFRGFAGQIASGVVRQGDAVTTLPSGRSSRIKSIVTWDGDLTEARAPMSVTLCLEDEIDISRGDMLVPASNLPEANRRFEATVVWMNERPLESHHPYLLKHTTQTVQARVRDIVHRVDINTLAQVSANRLQLNEIGVVSLEAQRALFFDPYVRNRATGSFILIDPISNETLGAGMITRAGAEGHSGPVTRAERTARIGHGAFVIRLQGGSFEKAQSVERHLFDRGYLVHAVPSSLDVTQAVLTGLEAGLVSILSGDAADSTLPAEVSPNQQLKIHANHFTEDRELFSAIDTMIAARDSDGGLTEGAGI